VSAEFNGGTFTHTFIFGTMDGAVSFWEPMITIEYFLSLKSGLVSDENGGVMLSEHKMKKSIDVPEAAAVAGYYPTSYIIEFDAAKDVYRVTLSEMVYLEESTGALESILCPPSP
jgi:hypothetical protein